MSLNEPSEVLDLEIEEETLEPEAEQPQPKEKPKLTPEQRRGMLQRELTKLNKELGITEEKPAAKTSDDLDYGQKAFLVANGLKGTDEFNLAKEVMSQTGKSLEDVLESKYFQAELKEVREAKVAAEAVPSTAKRSTQVARDSVEYWLQKGELPPASERDLRQKVVNARIGKESNTNVFTQNPVVK